MSPQQQNSGANAEAAAARTEEPGSPPAPSTPTPTPTPAPTPTSAPDEQAAGPAAAPEAEAAATLAGETATPPAPGPSPSPSPSPSPDAAATTAQAPEEGVAIAAAVGTAAPPGARTDTAVDRTRPRKPVLAGAAIAGAVLIAIPLLLAGSAREDRDDGAKGLAAEGSDTVLNPASSPAALDDYVAGKPSSSPSKEKAKKTEAPKVASVPNAAAPAPQPTKSSTAKAKAKPKTKPKSTPKPKAAAKPNWGTRTVYATSVLRVGQSWSTNRIRMVMQSDGNLVVYNEKNKPIWAAMTFGSNHRAIFQEDGNLVIHNGDNRPIWASKSHGHANAQLILRADGKVVILHNGGVIWST